MIDSWLLTIIWVLPIVISLLTFAIPNKNHLKIKIIHALGSGFNLILAISLTIGFLSKMKDFTLDPKSTITHLEYQVNLSWFQSLNINYHIGVDALSVLMILLTAIIIFAGVFASWKMENQVKEFFVLLNILVSGVYGVFMSYDLFVFFLFYEVAVLPMYLLIGVWGSTNKEYSSMKLTLMLVGASSLLFAGILGLYFESGIQSFNLLALSQIQFNEQFQFWAFPALFIGFGVLGALFPFHTWSPDGHAAAPTAVSMLHAGVLMKLGGYGCLRVAMYLLPEGAEFWMPYVMILIAFNVGLGPLIAIKQKDLKYITAYSSVSHLGLVLMGLGSLSYIGLKGASLQMIAHGLLTGLMFCLIGMIYGRTHTRQVDEMGGLMKVIPFLGVAWIIAGLAGLGLPGLSGFVAEVTIFIGAFFNGGVIARVTTIVAILSVTTTAIYVLRAANTMLSGPLNEKFKDLQDADWTEKIPVIILVACLIGMGVFPGWITEILDSSIQPIFQNLQR